MADDDDDDHNEYNGEEHDNIDKKTDHGGRGGEEVVVSEDDQALLRESGDDGTDVGVDKGDDPKTSTIVSVIDDDDDDGDDERRQKHQRQHQTEGDEEHVVQENGHEAAHVVAKEPLTSVAVGEDETQHQVQRQLAETEQQPMLPPSKQDDHKEHHSNEHSETQEERHEDLQSHQSEDSIDYASLDDGDDDDDDDINNNKNHNDDDEKSQEKNLTTQQQSSKSSSSSRQSLLSESIIAWSDITKRDRPLSASQAASVTTEVENVLSNRFENAEDGNFKDVKLKRFDDRLARFHKLEINIGRRIASGNFADIYCVNSWADVPTVATTVTTTTSTADNEDHHQTTVSSSTIKEQNPPKTVAVKLLRSNLLMTPKLYATAASDLVTEGMLLASFAEHPNIVTILGRSNESVNGFASGRRDSVFLVLERLECDMTVRLREWAERAAYKNNRLIHHGISGRRDNKAALLRERLTRMSELASAMAYLHRHNVIHRDLKLSNVGIDMNGSVKLLDFGLAKILPPHNDEKETFHLTGNTGSIRYMAPEVARGDKYNLKADSYSFSILLYEVMDLSKAFSGWDPREIMEKVHLNKYRPKTSLFWPKGIRDLLKATWSDIPSARLSMKNAEILLDQCLEEIPCSS